MAPKPAIEQSPGCSGPRCWRSRPAGLPLAGQLFDRPRASCLVGRTSRCEKFPRHFVNGIWHIQTQLLSSSSGMFIRACLCSNCRASTSPTTPFTKRNWPLEPFRSWSELRYKPQMLRAPRCDAQTSFLAHCLNRYELAGVVTTSYDLTPRAGAWSGT